ncbi:MAG: phosphatase PAP2 family protein [Patescibacteria group bacterium]
MNLDTKLFFYLHNFAHKTKLADRVILFFGSYLPFALVLLFPLYLFLIKEPVRQGIILCVGALSASLISRFLFGSPIRFFYPVRRPFVAHSLKPLINIHAPSFPSGHALLFFALATFIFFFNHPLGLGFFLATLLIVAARVSAGVHYPSDMLGGFLIGVASGYLVYFYMLPLLSSVF